MSRILEALKRAVPPSRLDAPSSTSQPLIFEKVNLKGPDPETVRRDIEAKKEEARRRYVLNESAPRPAFSRETRHFLWVFGALLAACAATAWLWPKPAPAPALSTPEETIRLHERIVELSAALEEQKAENERLRETAATITTPADESELQRLEGEVKRLNRRLAIMLQDNLAKDEEIARLSGRP